MTAVPYEKNQDQFLFIHIYRKQKLADLWTFSGSNAAATRKFMTFFEFTIFACLRQNIFPTATMDLSRIIPLNIACCEISGRSQKRKEDKDGLSACFARIERPRRR